MTRDYVLSFIAEGLAVILALTTYRIAAAQWDPDLFGEYALSRKVVSAVLVIALVGADIAVVRFIAFDAANDEARIAGYLSGAVTVVLATSTALAAGLVVLAGPLSQVVFGAPGHEAAVMAFAAVSLGGALYAVAYGYERARLRLGRAAGLLVVNTGIIPLLAVFAFPASVASSLAAMGAGWVLVAGLTLVAERRAAWARPEVTPMIRYGAPRALGLLVQMGLLAAPAIVAAHRFGLEEAGNVAFALLVLGLLSTLLTPIGVVLVPRSAEMFREGAGATLERHVSRLLTVVVPLVAVFVLLVQFAADAIVAGFLGAAYAGAAATLRVLLWAAIPWTFFVALRGLLDAHDVRPLNARNVVLASIAYALLVTVASSANAEEIAYHAAFVASVVILGVLTLVEARRVFASPPLAEPVVEDLLQP